MLKLTELTVYSTLKCIFVAKLKVKTNKHRDYDSQSMKSIDTYTLKENFA